MQRGTCTNSKTTKSPVIFWEAQQPLEKVMEKAPTADLFRLNTLRDIKIAFLTIICKVVYFEAQCLPIINTF